MAAKPDTPEGDRLDVLVMQVEIWEAKHDTLDLLDPSWHFFRLLNAGLPIFCGPKYHILG